jgi:sugar phosphate isomerase/epimerase
MPRISAFPRGFFGDLAEGRMTLFKWIDLAGQLEVDGLEMSPRFLASFDSAALRRVRQEAAARSLKVSMMRGEGTALDGGAEEVRQLRKLLQLTAELGGRACRFSAGQDPPGLDPKEGRRRAIDALQELLPYAESTSVTLLLENAGRDRFLAILDGVQSPWLKVQFDFATEKDPIGLLERVLPRLGAVQGPPDADPVWSRLARAGFDGWVGVEGGEGGSINEGLERFRGAVRSLRAALARHFTKAKP